jgi:hypothetical protein
MVKTVTRVPDWENALTLNGSSIKNSPGSARAQCFIAVALFENVYRNAPNKMELRWVVDSMENCINRSLEIYPNYSSALTMKPGIVAERYDFDKNLPKLLGDFLSVIERKPTSKFIEDYIVYLNKYVTMDREQLVVFCMRAADICLQKFRQPGYANRWLNLAASIDPANQAVKTKIMEITNNITKTVSPPK